MTYKTVLKPSAEKQLRRLPKLLRLRIIEKLSTLQTNPRSLGTIKLAGAADTWRVRVGDYRIVYEIHDSEHVVSVTIIAHRREVYRDV